MRTIILAGVGACMSAIAMSPTVARSEPIAQFYKGKTLRVIIGFGAGGGYDLYGRVFAQFIGRFVPGNPTVVVQNMPGAGSKVAAKYMYAVAPKDGTVFGSLSQNLAYDAVVLGTPKTEFDPIKLNYIGRLTSSVDLGLGVPGASFKSFEEARTRELVVGASGTAATSYLLPTALNRHGGAKFRVVTGYRGSNDILLAAERKEVDVVGSINLSVILSKFPAWVSERKAPIIYQGSLKRHPQLTYVPALPELGIAAQDKALLRAIAIGAEIGRAINTTPDVPKDRLDALRHAFDKMMKDPEVLSYMKERRILAEPMSGKDLDTIAEETATMSPKTIELAKALLK